MKMLYRGKLGKMAWLNCLELTLFFVLLWFLGGLIFSLDIFDDQTIHRFAVLNGSDNALTYAAILLTVQIPLFIQMLVTMLQAESMKRIVLPAVVDFREIIVGYVVLSFLILVSPREAFLYVPVVSITLLSLYAVMQSVTVMFNQSSLKDSILTHIGSTARGTFGKRLKSRLTSNQFIKEIESAPLLEYN